MKHDTRQHDQPVLSVAVLWSSIWKTKYYILAGLCLLVSLTQVQAAQTVSYSYNAQGQIASIDGPRTDINDVTTFDYDDQGNLITITNALGHVTEIAEHNASGRPTRIIDANQGITTLTYQPRGWLTSRTYEGQTTTFDYDNTGQLIKLTLPSGAFIQYTYDDAHRLTDIDDSLANRIHYLRDAMGNVLQEEVKDSTGQLVRLIEQEFDQLGRLILSIGGANQILYYQYDGNGNRIIQTDPRNTPADRNIAKTTDPLAQDNTLSLAYDALDRLIYRIHRQQSDDPSDDISSQYQYNALSQLSKVSDANGAETHYTYNVLGDLLELNSPDTGSTT
jgi:YD repeat-containing protein